MAALSTELDVWRKGLLRARREHGIEAHDVAETTHEALLQECNGNLPECLSETMPTNEGLSITHASVLEGQVLVEFSDGSATLYPKEVFLQHRNDPGTETVKAQNDGSNE